MRCKIQLASGLEGTLTLRDSTVRTSTVPSSRPSAATAQSVADIVCALLGDRIHEKEVVFQLSLDARSRVMVAREISVGSLMASVIHPREVYRKAFADNAAAIILAHNHPSGDATPSVEDHQVTARLAEAGALLGVRLVDHVVVAAEDYRSFKEQGWIA